MNAPVVTEKKLAIDGGPKTRTVPYGTGVRFSGRELDYLKEALSQNTLFYYKGGMVKRFTRRFADMNGFKYCTAVSSGTAAIHTALIALGVSVGHEVIVTPLTDMGSAIGILYQNAVPVFADIHPNNYTLDPAAVERAITPRTKAILAVHLTGGPCDMDAMLAIGKKHNIPVIEDCAQAWGSTYKGRPVGGLGVFGCFSTNDFKQVSTGDGGLVVTQDDSLGRAAFEIADKNYRRTAADADRAPKSLAPNYRMTELQGAVGLAQIERLDDICARRNRWGDGLTERIKDVPGIDAHAVAEGGKCTYMYYAGRIRPAELTVDLDRFIAALNAEGVPAFKVYSSPVYRYGLFRDRTVYPGSAFPLEGTGQSYRYDKGLCPVAEAVVDTSFSLPVSEFFTEQDLEETAAAVRKVARAYLR